MRDFSEFNKDYNQIKLKYGEKIFLKQLEGLEGVDIYINGASQPVKGRLVNEDNINNEKDEFRTLCVTKDTNIKHGDEVLYRGEYYLVVTDIDYHYYYQACKIKKCNNTLTWEMDGKEYSYPCILKNDSYGVKVLSDNDYIRSQNIKAQIIVQENEFTRRIVPDMRFIFNHSQFDIYNIIDVNKSITKGLITFTSEKSIIRVEDNLKENIAFSESLVEGNKIPLPSPNYNYAINGNDFVQNTNGVFSIDPLINCKFYIDDFDSNNIANIVIDDGNGTCTIYGKPNIADNWFTLYAKDSSDNILASKEIKVLKE